MPDNKQVVQQLLQGSFGIAGDLLHSLQNAMQTGQFRVSGGVAPPQGRSSVSHLQALAPEVVAFGELSQFSGLWMCTHSKVPPLLGNRGGGIGVWGL